MMHIDPEIRSMCHSMGHQINTDLNGAILLMAIAVIETSGGVNNYPNFEPYWIPDGTAFTIEGKIQKGRHPLDNLIVSERYAKHGMAAGCSYSAWQILYHTAADMGFDGKPWELWDNMVAITWVIKRLNKVAKLGASTVEQFADAWNSGSFKDKIVPERYIKELSEAYYELERAA